MTRCTPAPQSATRDMLPASPSRGPSCSSSRAKMLPNRRQLLLGALLSAALTGLMVGQDVFAKGRVRETWAGTWSMSPQGPETFEGTTNPGFANKTLRQIAHLSMGGEALRIRLSNAYGSSPLTIAATHVALQSSGASIVPHTDRVVTFSGRPSVTIPAGAVVVSDPVELSVKALSNLAVSVYVPQATGPSTWHLSASQTSYVSSDGDHTAAQTLPVATTEESVYWLSGVEVTAPERSRVVVAFGDSITDGYGSTPDAHRRWPDYLSAQLNRGHRRDGVGILNQGISGNRLLFDFMGSNALARFDRDALAQSGVTDLVILEGINDIGFPGSIGDASQNASAKDLLFALEQLAERAHARGIRVYVGTLTPFEGTAFPGYYSAEGEAKRQALNQSIRASSVFDGVIDFDAALRDPNQPNRLLEAFDSGDHLHPNDAGYATMAEAVEAKLFRR